MQKYDGILIYRTLDELGPIEVVDDALNRSLHFGTEPKQSSMRLAHPEMLVLSYTRAMTSTLFFMPQPRRILLIGLGGGSLAKFFIHHFPDSEVEVVEFRQQVYETARDWFALGDSPRLRVHIDDGAAFVRRLAQEAMASYDLILIDAFEAMGIADSVCASAFFDDCRTILTPKGMVSMNLWSQDRLSIDHILEQLRSSFTGELLQLPVGGKENVIALVGNQQGLKQQLKKMGDQARSMEQKLMVEYPQLLRVLRHNNRRFFF